MVDDERRRKLAAAAVLSLGIALLALIVLLGSCLGEPMERVEVKPGSDGSRSYDWPFPPAGYSCFGCGDNTDFGYTFRVADVLDWEDLQDDAGTPVAVDCVTWNMSCGAGTYGGTEYRCAFDVEVDGDGWMVNGFEADITTAYNDLFASDPVTLTVSHGATISNSTPIATALLDEGDIQNRNCDAGEFYFGDCPSTSVTFSPTVYLDAGETYWFIWQATDLTNSYGIAIWCGHGGILGGSCYDFASGYGDWTGSQWDWTASSGWVDSEGWCMPHYAIDGAEATTTPTATPTYPAWISEINPQPIPTGTPCTDWNLRSGCGANDAFVEVAVPEAKSLAGWQVRVREGISDTLQCQWEFRVDNWTWPMKVVWADMMEDGAWEDVCPGMPITGSVHLRDDLDDLIHSVEYTNTLTAGNSWAADDWEAPDGTWSDATPDPGR